MRGLHSDLTQGDSRHGAPRQDGGGGEEEEGETEDRVGEAEVNQQKTARLPGLERNKVCRLSVINRGLNFLTVDKHY